MTLTASPFGFLLRKHPTQTEVKDLIGQGQEIGQAAQSDA